ncbi:hypothetical protein TWF281_011209 [Arthrobotrys megalospora]
MIRFYILGFLALTIVNLAEYSIASPAGERFDLQKRVVPDFCTSEGVSRLASLLSANTASPFCSEYLSTGTVTVSQTETSQTYTTATTTINEFISTTQTVLTETLAFTVTTTDATRPTVIATSTSISITTTTFTTYPVTVTVVTSVWYTSSTVKKRGAIETTASVPAFLAGFAPPAISSGCSCLDIPSPTASVTETTYVPNTLSTELTTTITNTLNATLTVSTTFTVQVTSYTPATSLTTFTSTTTRTVTGGPRTSTLTISIPYRPQCTGILGGQKLFNSVQPRRPYTYPFVTTPIQNGSGGEDTFSQCCELCYRIPDCAQF